MKNTDLSTAEIKKHLSCKTPPEIILYKTIDSTNNEAKKFLSEKRKAPFIVLSEKQTNGRGRLGRSFYSPEKSGLYISIALSLKLPLYDTVFITSAAAVALARAIDETANVKTEIKWVNDIYLKGKKVAGILCEASSSNGFSSIVIGIGVNCTTNIFPKEIREIAASAGELDRNLLAAKIYDYLIYYMNNDWLDEYKKRSFVIGKAITYIEGSSCHTALAIDISETGGLIISENGKVKELSSGEITLRLNNSI